MHFLDENYYISFEGAFFNSVHTEHIGHKDEEKDDPGTYGLSGGESNLFLAHQLVPENLRDYLDEGIEYELRQNLEALFATSVNVGKVVVVSLVFGIGH